MDVAKIKCSHMHNDKPCIGTLSFLLKGDKVRTCPSSDMNEDIFEMSEMVIEDKCSCCKRKTMIVVLPEEDQGEGT